MTTAALPNVFLQGKTHLPHPTRTVRNGAGQSVPAPLCGQSARRFYPGADSREATCQKCLAAEATR